MLSTAPPLPAQPLVGLLADLRAKAIRHAAHRGALAAVHALICTALIRLFAGLQDLMELWQSGQLPPQTLATRAAVPPRAVASFARTLRPLGHRLGVALPPILQPPQHPQRPPAPPKPARRKPAPLPLYPQRKPRPMRFLTPLRKFRPA